jgi:hypothetical protein
MAAKLGPTAQQRKQAFQKPTLTTEDAEDTEEKKNEEKQNGGEKRGDIL